jgi:hypothetical protein
VGRCEPLQLDEGDLDGLDDRVPEPFHSSEYHAIRTLPVAPA